LIKEVDGDLSAALTALASLWKLPCTIRNIESADDESDLSQSARNGTLDQALQCPMNTSGKKTQQVMLFSNYQPGVATVLLSVQPVLCF